MSSRLRLACGSIVLVFCLAASGLAWAADADGDGIADAVERRLGTNPDVPEQFVLLINDGAKGAGDKNISSQHKLANDVVECWAGHVGGDRYVLKVVLAAPFNADRTIFHIYVDWDDDQSNGRQDGDWVRGVDIMYSASSGRFGPRLFTPQVRASAEIPPRWVVDGNTIYVCDDVKPKLADGKARFRVYILSHMADNTRDADTTVWATAEIAVDPSRKAPKPPVPVRKNFEVLPGDWELLGALWHDPTTVLLRPGPEDAAGYEWWHDASVVSKGEGGEKLTLRVPKAGRYYLACVIYGRHGAYPGIDVFLNGAPVGTMAAATSGFDQLLCYSSRPLAVKAGDEIVLSTAENSTGYRVGMIMLVAKRPEMPALRIENIQVWHMPDEPGKPRGRVLVTWRTNRRVNCKVRYSLAGPEAYVQEGEVEVHPGDGHRCFYVVLAPPEFRASRYGLRITAMEPPRPPYWPGQQANGSVVVEMYPPRPGKERSGEVKLRVGPGEAAAQLWWPVRSGVPIPRGRLWDCGRCQLLGPGGAPVDAQFAAWSYWPDRSIKWLIVDFIAPYGASSLQTYRLRYGVDPKPVARRIEIRRQGDNLVVDGRAIRVELPANAPLGTVWADRNNDGKVADGEVALPAADLVLIADDGKRYVAGPPDDTVAVEKGPLHAIVRRAGWFRARDGSQYFRYLVTVHVWRDRPHLYLEVSLDNANVKAEMSLLRRLALELPVSGDAVLAPLAERQVLQVPVDMLQDYDNRYKVNGRAVEGRLAGWMTVLERGRGKLMAAVRDFWRLWPKGFKVTPSNTSIELLPELAADAYQSPEDQELIGRLFFWCDRGRYKLRAGTRITGEVFLDFAPPPDPGLLAAEAANVNAPPFAAASPAHYCSSGAFGQIYPKNEKIFPRYDENIEWSFAEMMKRRERLREYGFINYGDWWGERKWNWGNEEYDTHWALALLFAHNGNLEMLRAADAAARHNSDVDTVHYHKDKRYVGKVYYHCVGHTGGYLPSSWNNMGAFARGGWNYGHTWAQGQLVCSALFGNYRLRETGLQIASETVRSVTPTCPFYARDAGWTLISMCAAYEATGNPWFLNGARLMAERILQRQDPLSGAMGSHFLDPNECKHRPRHYGPKPFMTGIMLRGLRMYHQLEPREDVKRAIVACADWMWNEAWVARDRGFWYSACPTFTSHGGTWTFNLVGDGLAYACLLDKQHFARRRAQLIEACAAHLYQDGRSSFGKGFTQEGCCMLYALEWMRRLGITNVQPPPKRGARGTVEMRSVLVLSPGEEREVYPFVRNPSPRARKVEVMVRDAPGWVELVLPEQTSIKAESASAVAVRARCAASAKPGQAGTVRLRFRIGGVSQTRALKVVVAGTEALGSQIGIITGSKDHLAQALEKVGVRAKVIGEACWDELRGLRVLIVGDEALLYDFAGLRDHLAELQRFVRAGGLLVVGQLNDDDWNPAMLPWDLYLDEPETAAGAIAAPDHALFARLAAAELAGIVSYDCIVWAAPQWRTLMTDTAGHPAVLEGQFGKGRVLVIQPSFDRPVVDPKDPHADRAGPCRKLLGNLARIISSYATGQ